MINRNLRYHVTSNTQYTCDFTYHVMCRILRYHVTTITQTEASPCNAISEGRPLFTNTSLEAGALPLEVRIENDLDRKFSNSKFFIFFWKPLFSTFHVTLFIVSRKYFIDVSNYAPTPRYTILDSRLPPCK